MSSKLRAWSRCLSGRMKLEGAEKANVSAKALKMSLAYQFVTPLTSMTIRGMADQDGLEPLIDKPLDGMGLQRGGCGHGEASESQKSPGH